jgi:hypothetical protein
LDGNPRQRAPALHPVRIHDRPGKHGLVRSSVPIVWDYTFIGPRGDGPNLAPLRPPRVRNDRPGGGPKQPRAAGRGRLLPDSHQASRRAQASVSSGARGVRSESQNLIVGTQADVDRYRTAIQTLQSKIAAESSKVAEARSREARARGQAARASSPSSAASRLREAEREGKKAVDAEKRRAQLERQLAEKQKALHQAEAKRAKEQTADHNRAMRRREDRSRRAERQFQNFGSVVAPIQRSAVGTDHGPISHDVFISHASEDKADVARPLADLLVDRGLDVWYDEFTLSVGDSLRRSIDRGLGSSRFGVVVLSPDFFRKEWTQAELAGLVAKQRASGGKVLLPIWHRITKDEVLSYSPTLADLKALSTAVMTLGEIADEITAVVLPG